MKPPQRGEIWLVDLGMRAKIRPVVVLSIGFQDQERALVTFVARTTQVRGSRFDVVHQMFGARRHPLMISPMERSRSDHRVFQIIALNWSSS
jgi:hypothetical protein